MASLYTTTLQKLLESVGAAKATQDPYFEAHIQNLTALGEIAEKFRDHVAHYVNSVSILTRSSHVLANDFKEAYEKVLEQPYTTSALKFETEMAVLEGEKTKKLEEYVAEKVNPRLKLWLEYLYELQLHVQRREECRVKYDHYKRKVADIRSEFEKHMAKGDVESQSEKEKRLRNEKKYEESKAIFDKTTAIVIESLDLAWKQRFLWINPILIEVAKTQIFFTDTLAKTHALMNPHLKTSLAAMPTITDNEDPSFSFIRYKSAKEVKAKERNNETETDNGGFFSSFFSSSKPITNAMTIEDLNLFADAHPKNIPEILLAPSGIVLSAARVSLKSNVDPRKEELDEKETPVQETAPKKSTKTKAESKAVVEQEFSQEDVQKAPEEDDDAELKKPKKSKEKKKAVKAASKVESLEEVEPGASGSGPEARAASSSVASAPPANLNPPAFDDWDFGSDPPAQSAVAVSVTEPVKSVPTAVIKSSPRPAAVSSNPFEENSNEASHADTSKKPAFDDFFAQFESSSKPVTAKKVAPATNVNNKISKATKPSANPFDFDLS